MSEEIVSMDAYWNQVATPLFFIVLLFGIFVLFKVSPTQVVGSGSIAGMINVFRKGTMTYAKKPVAAATAAAPAAAPA